jgi:hypothetical protein
MSMILMFEGSSTCIITPHVFYKGYIPMVANKSEPVGAFSEAWKVMGVHDSPIENMPEYLRRNPNRDVEERIPCPFEVFGFSYGGRNTPVEITYTPRVDLRAHTANRCQFVEHEGMIERLTWRKKM